MFIDLSQTLEDGMVGFRVSNEDGSTTAYTAEVRPFLTHEASKPKFGGQACFEITEVRFQTSVGTYIDSPYHRFPDGKDIAAIQVDEVVADGVLVDVTGLDPWQSVGADAVPADVTGKAVLFRFGWDRHWGAEAYHAYPFLHAATIDRLVASRPALVGVDTINIDDRHDLSRPAHTRLLGAGIYVVENLCNLGALEDQRFRFFAVPVKVKGAAAMPVRAFAELT